MVKIRTESYDVHFGMEVVEAGLNFEACRIR